MSFEAAHAVQRVVKLEEHQHTVAGICVPLFKNKFHMKYAPSQLRVAFEVEMRSCAADSGAAVGEIVVIICADFLTRTEDHEQMQAVRDGQPATLKDLGLIIISTLLDFDGTAGYVDLSFVDVKSATLDEGLSRAPCTVLPRDLSGTVSSWRPSQHEPGLSCFASS